MKAKNIIFVVVTLLASASGLRAQQQPTEGAGGQASKPTSPISPLPTQDTTGDSRQTPQPAGRAPLTSYIPQDQAQNQDSGQVQPDSHTLSGGQVTGLGSSTGPHRLLVPAV